MIAPPVDTNNRQERRNPEPCRISTSTFGEGGTSRPMRPVWLFPRSMQPSAGLKSMASSIIGQDECAPESVLGWDIEVTDEAGQTMLMLPVSDGQKSMLTQQAA
jgi:hypothetical protein